MPEGKFNTRAMRVVQAHLRRQAGHEEITLRGRGWTEREAWSEALNEFTAEEGYRYQFREFLKRPKQLKAPKVPKKVIVEQSPIEKGKVEKAYVIEWMWSAPGARHPLVGKRFKTQSEVLKAAKQVALETKQEVRVIWAAFCQGNTELARVRPERGEMGEWEFVADFHV